jgi:hypothetical protein
LDSALDTLLRSLQEKTLESIISKAAENRLREKKKTKPTQWCPGHRNIMACSDLCLPGGGCWEPGSQLAKQSQHNGQLMELGAQVITKGP